MSQSKPGVLRSLLIIAAGLVFVFAGYKLSEQLSPYPDGISTTGKVTSVRTGQDDGTTMYTAVITFTTRDGREVSIDAPNSSSSRPKIGTSANVSYRPDDPEGGRVIPDRNWISIVCYLSGGLVALIGLGSLVLRLLAVAGFLTRLNMARRSRTALGRTD